MGRKRRKNKLTPFWARARSYVTTMKIEMFRFFFLLWFANDSYNRFLYTLQRLPALWTNFHNIVVGIVGAGLAGHGRGGLHNAKISAAQPLNEWIITIIIEAISIHCQFGLHGQHRRHCDTHHHNSQEDALVCSHTPIAKHFSRQFRIQSMSHAFSTAHCTHCSHSIKCVLLCTVAESWDVRRREHNTACTIHCTITTK